MTYTKKLEQALAEAINAALTIYAPDLVGQEAVDALNEKTKIYGTLMYLNDLAGVIRNGI